MISIFLDFSRILHITVFDFFLIFHFFSRRGREEGGATFHTICTARSLQNPLKKEKKEKEKPVQQDFKFRSKIPRLSENMTACPLTKVGLFLTERDCINTKTHRRQNPAWSAHPFCSAESGLDVLFHPPPPPLRPRFPPFETPSERDVVTNHN